MTSAPRPHATGRSGPLHEPQLSETELLLAQIEQTCRRLGMAQSTFGRRAVNDGKFVTRLQQGGRVTMHTIARVQRFIEEHDAATAQSLRAAIRGEARSRYRFELPLYDRHEKYRMFVSMTSEKQAIADRAVEELAETQPAPPAIRMFDGGAGEGSVLARVLRSMHSRYPWLPFYVVAKENDARNVSLLLQKMADRLQEHPATVIVVTNLKFADAARLAPASTVAAGQMVWQELALKGTTSGEFASQIGKLEQVVSEHWADTISSRSSNVARQKPVVLVIYRQDHRFPLAPVLPRPGCAEGEYDFVLLSQSCRPTSSAEFRASQVVGPLVRTLRTGGRLLGVHAHGNDPGLEIIRSVWPNERPFAVERLGLMSAVADHLGEGARDFRFHTETEARTPFRYELCLPARTSERSPLGCDRSILSAWSAATYVAQIDDCRIAQAMENGSFSKATREVLECHGGLWFLDESYVISRKSALG